MHGFDDGNGNMLITLKILQKSREMTVTGNREIGNFESARFLQFKPEIRNLKSEVRNRRG
jgi:hypothetical protein